MAMPSSPRTEAGSARISAPSRGSSSIRRRIPRARSSGDTPPIAARRTTTGRFHTMTAAGAADRASSAGPTACVWASDVVETRLPPRTSTIGPSLLFISEPKRAADLELVGEPALSVLVLPRSREVLQNEVDSKDGRPGEVRRPPVGLVEGVGRLDVQVPDVHEPLG